MIIEDIHSQKEIINYIISQGLNEIIGSRFNSLSDTQTMQDIEGEIFSLMDALVQRNKIFDYGFSIEYDHLFSKFKGAIAYSLINTEKIIDEKDLEKFEEVIEFSF